jgi:hypothetical protein
MFMSNPSAQRAQDNLLDLLDAGTRERQRDRLAELDARRRAEVEPNYEHVVAGMLDASDRSHRVYSSTFDNGFVVYCELETAIAREAGHPLPVPALPSRPGLVAAYLQFISDNGASAAKLRRHVAAINYVNRMRGYAAPGDDPLIKAMLKVAGAAEKLSGKPNGQLNGHAHH